MASLCVCWRLLMHSCVPPPSLSPVVLREGAVSSNCTLIVCCCCIYQSVDVAGFGVILERAFEV